MNDVRCEEALEHLGAAVDGEPLLEATQKRVDKHLDACPACARAARQMSSVHRLLLELQTEEMTPEDRTAETKSRMPARPRGGSRSSRVRRALRPRRQRWGGLAAVAAIFLALVGLGALGLKDSGSRPGLAERAETVARRAADSPGAIRTPSPAEPLSSRAGSEPRQPPAIPAGAAEVPPGGRSPKIEIPALPVDGQPPAARQAAPETDRPRFAPKPAPLPPRGDTEPAEPKTEASLVRLTWFSGSVRYARGAEGLWVNAVRGIQFMPGDRLKTGSGLAQLEWEDGSRVCIGRQTILTTLQADKTGGKPRRLDLTQGEIYIEDQGQSLQVSTPEGLFTPIGTRFGVKRRLRTTTLMVEEGIVEARSKGVRHKPVRVVAGRQTRISRNAAPTTPRRVRLTLAMTWLKFFRGPQVHLETFESVGKSGLPAGWRSLSRPDLIFQAVRDDTHGGKQALRIIDRSVEKQGKIWLDVDEPLRKKLLGRRVRLAVWLKAVAEPAQRGHLSIHFRPQGRKSIHFTVEPRWKRYQIECRIPSDLTSSITCYVCTTGTEITGDVLVDDFSLEILRP